MAEAAVIEKLEALHKYSACDISDALLKLEKVEEGQRPLAGFLANICPIAPCPPASDALSQQSKVIAPASTVHFQPKFPTSSNNPSPVPRSNIPSGSHWVDLTDSNTVVVLDQPLGQNCAVLGGIMAARMKYLGAKAIVVTGEGRVRDVTELRSLGLPIWSRSTSTAGTAAEAKPWAINIPIYVGGLTITPRDIMFCDPVEGVVVIPQDLLDAVLELLPNLVQADDRVKEDVKNGVSVQEAFAKHRKG
ncbi:MAG: hypothetical protein M1830_008095, partial [Pleopsidium flavum]